MQYKNDCKISAGYYIPNIEKKLYGENKADFLSFLLFLSENMNIKTKKEVKRRSKISAIKWDMNEVFSWDWI